MKNIYLLTISLLFFTIQMTATPVQTANSKTETTTQKKPTFKERIAHKFLKKKLKKIKKQNNVKTNRLATASFVFGVLAALFLLGAFSISSLAAVIISLLLSPILGLIGVILGVLALNRMKGSTTQNERKTFAIIGLTLGAICGAAILLMLITGYIV